MTRSLRLASFLGVLLTGLVISGVAFAAPSASIEQVRNGQATAPTTPIPSWSTGNAGASNSHYLESHSIAYRAVMGDLPTDGSVIELVIGYDVKRSGSYALDYLTHYQRLLPHVLFSHSQPEAFDPLAGVAGVSPMISHAPIPVPGANLVVDPDGAESEPAMPQPSTSAASLSGPEREMTLFGGTLIDVSYVSEADVNFATKSSESRVKVRFKADSPQAVLAWGGHIACRWDWGFNADGTPRSAGGISGSSYHMRLVSWNLGNLGNQDRSMSTDAVYPVPRCGVSNLGPFCAGTTHVHDAPAGMESYLWTLTDNTSGASIVGPVNGPSVTVLAGNSGGGYRLVVTTGASGFTKDCDGTVTVLDPVTADAGTDQTVCASAPQVTLAGQVGGGNGAWSGGAGTFVPNATALNATYTPSAAEVAAGHVTLTLTGSSAGGTCPPASDAMSITIQKLATANAGVDLAVCANLPQVILAGTVGGSATSGTWSGGTGTFVPNASTLNATYTPSAAEIAAGSVTLTLTSNDPDGPCGSAADQVQIAILPAATANAGLDLTVCASAPQAQLAGNVGGGASSGGWSGGAGSYSPNAASLTAIYTPSAAEIAAGQVTLTLTTNDPAGPCGAAQDQVVIAIRPAATANAGADQVVCASSPQVTLAGIVGGGATGGTWSGGNGTFSPGASTLNATYTPSAAEIAAGHVTLTLTTNDPEGPCGAVADAMVITLSPAAIANAGADQRVCASAPQVSLAGSVGGGASSGTWSGGAGNFKPNASSLGATYTPTAAEIAAGQVRLTLTTNDPSGPCGAVSDAMTIRIDPITVVDAGIDQTVCSSSPKVTLAGSVGGTVTNGTWSGGAGSYSPGPWVLNAVYTPSAGEITAGSVTLTLTSATPGGPCGPASDQIRITIQPAATVSAGPDQKVCATTTGVQLAASLGGAATSGTWTGGWGTFTPNANAWNAVYAPTASEAASGSVTLTYTTNDPAGPCGAVHDDMTITFDAPVVTVANRVVCEEIASVSLCANVTRGQSPYTYRWSNGATTQCITVADTGLYSVTITDGLGCTATGSGRFGHRDCVGQLTHTTATCSSFMDGTAEDFDDVHYVLRDGVISSISPGVFFYWTEFAAPSANFTVQIVQTKDNPSFPFIPVQQGQVSPYDANCNRLTSGVESSPGQATFAVTGATVGKVYIVSVKYSLKDLVGTPMPPGSGVHYDFRTEVNGQVVDADPDGLQIGEPQAPVAGTGGSTGTGGPVVGPDGEPVTDDPIGKLGKPTNGMNSERAVEGGLPMATFRPSPNPFTSGTRMAYAVSTNGTPVSIRVVDVSGRLVRTLVHEIQSAGGHFVSWDGRDERGQRMRTGVYFIHVNMGNQVRQVRVTMLQ